MPTQLTSALLPTHETADATVDCCWLLAAVLAVMPSGWRAATVRAAQAALLSSTPPEAGLLLAQQPVRGAAEVKAAGAAAAQERLESTDAFSRSPPPFLPALVAVPNRSLVAHPVLCASALVNGVSPAACLIAGLRQCISALCVALQKWDESHRRRHSRVVTPMLLPFCQKSSASDSPMRTAYVAHSIGSRPIWCLCQSRHDSSDAAHNVAWLVKLHKAGRSQPASGPDALCSST
jgi:hypothetical protein